MADNPATSWALNPWVPMSKPIDVKHLGKLGEELNECGSAVSRCLIQGIDEAEPITGVVNRQWLQNEIADVLANITLVVQHFRLDTAAISARAELKKGHLRGWHSMLEPGDVCHPPPAERWTVLWPKEHEHAAQPCQGLTRETSQAAKDAAAEIMGERWDNLDAMGWRTHLVVP